MISSPFILLILLAQAPPEAECLDLAKKIETSVREGQGAWLDKTFDVDAMIDRGLKGVEMDAKFQVGFRKGVRKSFAVGRQSAEMAAKDGGFKFMRLKSSGSQTRAIFRLTGNDEFNYQEYLLEASPKGGLRIVDYMTYLNGEWVSEAMRRMCIAMMASEPGALGKAFGRENAFVLDMVQTLPKLKQMELLRSQGKPDEALKIFDTLPESLKKEKCALMVRCMSAGAVGGKTALEALDAFQKAYPGDPSIAILSLGPYTREKKFEEALLAIDLLEKAVGEDSYLDYQRAEVHGAAGAFDKARQAAARAMEKDRALPDPYWMMVTLSLKEKKFGETAKWLSVIEKELKIQLGDLSGADEYKDFVRSPECKAWMESRRRR